MSRLHTTPLATLNSGELTEADFADDRLGSASGDRDGARQCTGSARLRVRGNYERTFAVGDFTTLWWGRLLAVDPDSITIDETMPDGKGGWQSRTARLPMQGKPARHR